MEQFVFENEKTRKLSDVYNHFADEESRKIYIARSCYSLSNDRVYLKPIIRNMSISQVLINFVSQNKGKKVLFGYGIWGRAIVENFPEIKWDYVVDNYKAGMTIGEMKVNSFEDIFDYEDDIFVVATMIYYEEIEQQLIKKGVNSNRILNLGKVNEKKQYFDLEKLNFCEQAVFVDCGGFDGNTTKAFITHMGEKSYKEIFVFEPNNELYEKCKANLEGIEACNVIKKGTWCKRDRLCFKSMCEASMINKEGQGDYIIETTTIDDELCGKKCDYIKMDIEGAEIESIIGARKTIARCKPQLAISVYHKRDDIWEIPKLLLEINPNYKFFLRNYSFTGNDTVLYAI